MTRRTQQALREAPLIPLEDLPRYSPWPARLLGLSAWRKPVKSEAELYREYEEETFAPYLERARSHYAHSLYREWFAAQTAGTGPSPCHTECGLRLLTPGQQLEVFIDAVQDALAPHLPAPALCDLGAGTGKILYCLAQRGVTRQTPLLAFEFSPSARELIRHFSRNQGLDMQVHACNFLEPRITEAAIPRDAVLFTSFALACVPRDATDFLRALAAFRPRVVAHFEPCADFFKPDNLQHMMCRRYVEINGYNADIHIAARELEAEGVLRVLATRPNVFGGNPLLPFSTVVWTPA
ncbi:MAG: class I SAM-dependent methyltransferase [Desulfovibrionaceae bacterium]|nr:class I SAM-dependent methyltransferase [Desulfovibrionaceae bacterium]